MANKSYGKCLYKGNCDLNCQVFVCDDENQTCVACKHHSAFHEQLQPADTSKLKQTSYDGGSAGTSLLQSIPSTSGLNLQQQTQGKLKTLEEWKASKTKKSFDYRTKGSRKKNENLDQEVTINIGLMEFGKKGVLKAKWGKRLPLTVLSSASCAEICEKACIKWKAFYKGFLKEGEEYLLLLEDGSHALFLPGHTKEFFTLRRYKEEVGRGYRRMTLYLCSREDFEKNYRRNVLGKTDSDVSDQEESNDMPDETFCPEDMDCSATAVSSNQARSTNSIPEEFLWGDWEDFDENELVKAATARSCSGLSEQTTNEEDVSLDSLLKEFKENNMKDQISSVIILRKKILQTSILSIKDSKFDFLNEPCIVFSGEDSADLGGPRREFFRLLIKATCQELGVFEGCENSLVFSHNHAVISAKKPYLAGQFIAWSVLHGGPGPMCIAEDVFYLIMDLDEEVNATRAASVIADEVFAGLATKVVAITTEEEFAKFKDDNSDLLLDQGIGAKNKDMLLLQIVKQALLYRVKSTIDLFLQGLESTGNFLKYMRKNPKAFAPLFIQCNSKVTVQQLRGLYSIHWSLEGSNNYSKEQDTIYCWDQFIQQVADGQVPGIKLEDILVFITGAEKVPPLGFERLITIEFFDTDGEQRRPWASTCSLQLNLPRGIQEYQVLKELMVSSLKESFGFGKV